MMVLNLISILNAERENEISHYIIEKKSSVYIHQFNIYETDFKLLVMKKVTMFTKISFNEHLLKEWYADTYK